MMRWPLIRKDGSKVNQLQLEVSSRSVTGQVSMLIYSVALLTSLEGECIGKGFAELEAISALAFLLKRLEFKVSDDYVAQPIFTGFGYRPFDATTKKVCLRMIPMARR